jgi:hypothetical protein
MEKLLRLLKKEHWRAWTLTTEACRLKMNPGRVCRPMVDFDATLSRSTYILLT